MNISQDPTKSPIQEFDFNMEQINKEYSQILLSADILQPECINENTEKMSNVLTDKAISPLKSDESISTEKSYRKQILSEFAIAVTRTFDSNKTNQIVKR